MCWFLAGSGYLRGLIWLEGIRRNLRLLEGLELIFECGMDVAWWGGGEYGRGKGENNRGKDGRNGKVND